MKDGISREMFGVYLIKQDLHRLKDEKDRRCGHFLFVAPTGFEPVCPA